MKLVRCDIMGRTPLLCHRFTDAAAMKATEGTGSSMVGGSNGTPKEQAEQGLYISETKDLLGKPIIPGPNLFRAIIDAGKFFKNGKSKVTTQKSSLIPAGVWLQEIEIPIVHQEPWTIDTRPVRIPSTGGRILRHRACFHDWALSFSLQVDEGFFSMKLIRDIIDAAGMRIGLGDFRPDCKGPFGQFVVTGWAIE